MLDLLEAAEFPGHSPYNPYSNFDVGAAILTTDGLIYTGFNVENANYTLTKHAEEVAVLAAIIEGAINREGRAFIQAVAVACESDAAPCGGCRQFLNEFIAPDAIWYGRNTKTRKITSVPFAEIFPYSFGPADLGV